MTTRSDLLALDENALATLANRGLVKRATKEIERGTGPTVELLDDGTVIGRTETTVTTLPPNTPLKKSECTCGAASVCRHRVATVLAYQRSVSAEAHGDATTATPASAADRIRAPLPSLDVDDEALQSRLGKSAWATAQRARSRGYSATLRFDAPPRVLLPTCTVVFLVPWDLSHVRCDCEQGVDCEHVALAVWALREGADLESEQNVRIEQSAAPVRGTSAIEAFRGLTRDLIAMGWSGATDGSQARTAALSASLKKERFVWLDDLLGALLTAVGEYESGLVGADSADCSLLLAEAFIRSHAMPTPSTPQAHLHGESSVGATKMDRVVLRGLGARYRVQGRIGRLSVFFRERASADALVLTKTWTVEPGHTPPAGPAIGRRRIIKTMAQTLATANVTTKGATRRPNREVEISASGLQTSVLRGTGSRLDTESDYGKISETLAARAASVFSPRIRAGRVVTLDFVKVVRAGWDPGAQTVWGELADANDATIIVASPWTPEAPAAPGVLCRALTSGARYLTGEASLRRGTLWVEPLSIGFEDEPVAVDLADDESMQGLPVAPLPTPDDPVAHAALAARGWILSTAVRGVSNLTGAQLAQGEGLVPLLHGVGLLRLGDAVQRLVDDRDRVDAWGRAAARAELTLHALARTT